MTIVTLLLVAVTPVSGANITWIGGDGDKWQNDEKWDLNRQPLSSDRAIINNGTRCEIDHNTAVCQSIEIDNSSTVRMLSGSVLTLGDGYAQTSNMDYSAKLEIGYGGSATLEISGGHKIKGSRWAIIDMLHVGSEIVEKYGEDDVLTIEHSCGDTLEMPCSVGLRGIGEIEVTLVNNAHVLAQTDGGTLYLSTRDKSGDDGVWLAGDNGRLYVNCEITGAAAWSSGDNIDGGLFEISGSGCVNSTGDVLISGAGMGLKVNDGARFCTTGNLEFKSSETEGDPTETSIFVGEDNAVAIFGVSACYAGGGC